MDGFTAAAALLPAALRRAALALSREDRDRCEEFRLRRGREMTILLAGREDGQGGFLPQAGHARPVCHPAACGWGFAARR